MSRGITIAAAITVLFGCAAGAGSLQAAEPECAGATDRPDAATLSLAGAAVVCLVNAERAKRDVSGLRISRQLARAALGHSADMVAHGYFSHTGRDGASPRRRVRRAGYRARPGFVNEALAIGSGRLGTPELLVRQLMRDPPHRRILLDRRYRHIGVGIVPGYPAGERVAEGTTLTLNFGRR